jgi:uncharacterized membrane protein
MKKRTAGKAVLGSFLLGAGAMYFLDPDRGRRRRMLVRDKMIRARHEAGDLASKAARDLRNRSEGILAKATGALTRMPAPDSVLEQRVRAALGHVVSHPGAITVAAKNGAVVLSGWIRRDEMESAIQAAGRVSGVQSVRSHLRVPEHPEHVSALQGGVQRRRRFELLQEQWAPAPRLSMAGLGAAAALYGLLRRDPAGAALAAAGAALATRAGFNRSFKRLLGVAGKGVFRVEKTMRIDAPVSELYEFWADPRNYPQVFAHVESVSKTGENTYEWRVRGPAGVAVGWEGSITATVPNELVAWKSVPGSQVGNEGVARFDPNDDGSTRVHIRLSYDPPAGVIGHLLAEIFGVDPKHALDEDMVRLKSLFEQGKTRVRGRQVTREEVEPRPHAGAREKEAEAMRMAGT